MTAPLEDICATALHPSPFQGYIFFCINVLLYNVKHCNYPMNQRFKNMMRVCMCGWGGVKEWQISWEKGLKVSLYICIIYKYIKLYIINLQQNCRTLLIQRYATAYFQRDSLGTMLDMPYHSGYVKLRIGAQYNTSQCLKRNWWFPVQ